MFGLFEQIGDLTFEYNQLLVDEKNCNEKNETLQQHV
jgi:hypothetical protein